MRITEGGTVWYRAGRKKTAESPTLLWDLQQPVPLARFGLSEKEAFETAFQEAVTTRPDELHGVIATSGDSQGKFSTLTNFLKANLDPNTPIGKLVQRENRVVRLFHFEWGAPFSLIPDEFRSQGTQYRTNAEARAIKQKEVNLNEQILAERIYTLQELRQQHFIKGATIDIFFGDLIADSGFDYEGERAGIVRGHQLLRDITHGTGQFSNAALGEMFFLPVYAPFYLRQSIRQLRAATAKADTLEKKKEIYAAKGISIKADTDEQAVAYLQNEAPSNEWDLLDWDEAEVIAAAARLGEIPMPKAFPPNMIDEDFVIGATDLKGTAMAQYASPFILRNVIEAPAARTLFSSNGVSIDSGITIHLEMTQNDIVNLDHLREVFRRPILPHTQT